MRYLFACDRDHITEQPLLWSEYERLPRNGFGDAVVPCECGEIAKRVYTPAFHSCLFIGGGGPKSAEEGQGFDAGAGRYFANKAERTTWQRETGRMDSSPEDRDTNSRFLADIKEAAKDGVNTHAMRHPHADRWEKPANDLKARKYSEARHQAATYLADVQVAT